MIVNRRDLLRLLIVLPLTGAVVVVLYPILSFLSPKKEKKKKGPVELGSIKDIPPGKSKLVQDIDNNPVMVINSEEYGLIAVSAICTHLGCIVHRNDEINRTSECGKPMGDNTHCVCHGGVYSVTGEVLGGPPPRHLPKYEIFVKDRKIYLGDLKPGERLFGA
jgi:cytochrome b6-f complex iron-sulfur subunit